VKAVTTEAGRVAFGTLGGLLALFLAIPVAALVIRAIATGSLTVAFATPAVMDALVLSLTTTSVSLVLILLFGTPLAYLLARRRFRGVGVVETVLDLPLVLPPSVAGLALLLAFSRNSLLGGALDVAGIQIPFPQRDVHIDRATPLPVRVVDDGSGTASKD